MVKIGLVDVDSKIPNLALMKISAYHKGRGDEVGWYNPMLGYDLVYASKVFDFTPDYAYYPKNTEIIKGGSGYSLKEELHEEIEKQYPDYSLYHCDYAIGFVTRGCIRNCEFCIVPQKEGKIKQVARVSDFCLGK